LFLLAYSSDSNGLNGTIIDSDIIILMAAEGYSDRVSGLSISILVHRCSAVPEKISTKLTS
jgi:hypothetical protein